MAVLCRHYTVYSIIVCLEVITTYALYNSSRWAMVGNIMCTVYGSITVYRPYYMGSDWSYFVRNDGPVI